MTATPFSWEVECPSAARASFGNVRPKASLHIVSDSHGAETLVIPIAVAKSLKADHDAGTIEATSRGELIYLLDERMRSFASKRIARLVDRRDYSAKELDEKLAMDGYPSSVRESAVARAVEVGIVDDFRYADVLIRTKIAAGWGRDRIERELSRRGIDPVRVIGWPFEYLEEGDEEQRAYEIARTRTLAQKNPYEKLVRFLCGKGYGLGVACRAARRVVDEACEDGLPY